MIPAIVLFIQARVYSRHTARIAHSCLIAVVACLLFASATARADCSAAPIASTSDMVVSFLANTGTQVAPSTEFASSVKEGMLVYDNTNNALRICNGTTWQTLEVTGNAGVAAGTVTGAVQFRSSTGIFAADDTNFVWDDSTNKLGIGTASPSYTLDVNGTGNFSGGIVDIGASGHRLNGTDSNLAIVNAAAGNLTLQHGVTVDVTVTSTGKVGIGTTDPKSKLDVAGGAKVGTEACDNNKPGMLVWDSNVLKICTELGTLTSIVSSAGILGGSQWQNGTSGKIYYSGGNVGIGLNNPSTAFEVVGTIKSSGPLWSSFGGAGTLRGVLLENFDDTASAHGVDVGVKLGGNEFQGLSWVKETGWTTASGASAKDVMMQFGVLTDNAAQTAMVIKSDGSVGIGTTGPGFAASTGRTYLTIQGSTKAGVTEYLTNEADADGNAVGLIQFSDKTTTATTEKRVAAIMGALDGTTANLRGGALRFYTRDDNTDLALTERMRIARNGNVGIGTNNPSSLLEVNSGNDGASALQTVGSNANKRLTIGYSVSGVLSNVTQAQIFADASAGNLNIASRSNYASGIMLFTNSSTVASERMRITSTGNVGIGTTGPEAMLDVAGGARVGADTSCVDAKAGTLAFNGGTLQVCISTAVGYVTMASASGGSSQWVNGTSGAIYYAGGNVGIGTTTPTNLLSLDGDAARTIWMERSATSAATGNSLTLQAGGTKSGNTDQNGGGLVLSSGTATGTGSSNITFKTAPAGTTGTSDRAPATAMTILGNGNVGIGTTAPVSGKFEVFETISSGSRNIVYLNPYTNGTGSPQLKGVSVFADSLNTAGSPTTYGVFSYARNVGTGTLSDGYGVYAGINKASTGPVTNAYALYSIIQNGNATGAITNAYGLYIADSVETGAITNDYGVYQVDTSATNYFGGNVGIGTTNPLTKAQIGDAADATATVLRVTNSAGADANPTLSLFRTGSSEAVISYIAGSKMLFGTEPAAKTTAALTTAAKVAIDMNNGNVGIGTTGPEAKLDVAGGARVGADTGCTDAKAGMLAFNGGTLQVCISTALGFSNLAGTGGGTSQWTTTGSDIYYSAGKVAIGTATTSGAILTVSQPSSSGTPDLIFKRADISTVDLKLNHYAAGTGWSWVFNTSPVLSFVDGTNINLGLNGSGAGDFTLGMFTRTGTDAAGRTLTIAAGPGTGTGTPGSIVFKTAPAAGSSSATVNALATAMTILGNGNVGIGTTNPLDKLHVMGGIRSQLAGNGVLFSENNKWFSLSWVTGYVNLNWFSYHDGTNWVSSHAGVKPSKITANNNGIYFDTAATMGVGTTISDFTTKLFVGNGGNVGIGTTAPDAALSIVQSSNDVSTTRYAGGGGFEIRRANGSLASPATVASAETIGDFSWRGFDGTSNVSAARIRAEVDGTVSTGVVPGRITFRTTNAAGTQAERMRIDNAGNVGIGTTTPTDGKLVVTQTAVASTGYDEGVVSTLTPTSDGESHFLALGSTGNLRIAAQRAAGSYNPMVQANDAAITFSNGPVDTGGLVLAPHSITAKGLRIDGPTGKVWMSDICDETGANCKDVSAGWAGGGTPGGSPTHVQFNDGGAFGGSANFAWNNTSNYLSLTSGSEWPMRTLFDKTAATHRTHYLAQSSLSGGGVTANTTLGGLAMGGRDSAGNYSAGWNGGAEITAIANETWSATARGTNLTFNTTANGAANISERMRIDNAGNVGIGMAGTAAASMLQVAGGIQLSDDTATCPGASNVKVGTMRYRSGNLELCRAGGWSGLVGSTAASFSGTGGITTAAVGHNTITSLSEVFDIGGNFNPTTGLFTAPAAGQYLFIGYVHGVATGNNYMTYLKINGSYQYYGSRFSNSPSPNPISNIQVILNLNAGDTVGLALYTDTAASSVTAYFGGSKLDSGTASGGGGGTPGGATTQVQFNNSGAFAGDAGLVWDNTNKYLDVSHTTWDGYIARSYNAGGGGGAAGGVVFVRGRGTQASPTPPLANDLLGLVAYRSYAETGGAEIRGFASENQSSGVRGGYLSIYTTPNGTAVPLERMRIDASGNVGIGMAGTAAASMLQVAGGIQLSDDTATCPGASNVKVGTLRYNTGALQLCGTAGWASVGSGGSGTSVYFDSTSASQSIPNTAWTAAVYGTQLYDVGGDNYNPTTGVFTVPTTGFYQLSASTNGSWITTASLATMQMSASAAGNICTATNDHTDGAGSLYAQISCSGGAYLTAGQTVSVAIFQNSGAARAFSGRFSGVLINGASGGGSGTPGGATTQVQFNNSGAFGGDAEYTWDSTGNVLDVTGTVKPSKVLLKSNTGLAAPISGSSYWASNGTDVWRASGNVGIGMTGPSYKLDVNGTANATAFRSAAGQTFKMLSGSANIAVNCTGPGGCQTAAVSFGYTFGAAPIVVATGVTWGSWCNIIVPTVFGVSTTGFTLGTTNPAAVNPSGATCSFSWIAMGN